MNEDFFYQTFLGNSIARYCWFAGILLAGLLFRKFLAVRLSFLLFSMLRRYAAGVTVDNFVLLLSKPLKFFLLVLACYFAFDQLEFPGEWKLVPAHSFGLRMVLIKLFQTLVMVSITWVMLRVLDFFALILVRKAKFSEDRSRDQLIPFVKEGIKLVLALFSFFIILGTVFHLNITSLIAGLGIGGLAVALAAKETLENLLGSFTIFVDEPFRLGDHVKVGNVSGTVEKIGFRSTRIRTLEKSFVTVPNKKMVDAETENLSMRTSRREAFSIHLSYSTSHDQVQSIVREIKELIVGNPLSSKEELSVLFAAFGAYAIEIKIDYYILTTDNETALQVKEQVNFGIMDIVSKNGSSFAVSAMGTRQ